MDPSAARAKVVFLASGLQTVRYVHVVNVSLLVFDYSLTLSREMSLMWSSKWSLSKVLFFCTRYSPIFDVTLLVYYSMVSNLSPKHCYQLQSASAWGTVFGIGVAEAILVLRTYALSGRKRGALIFFMSMWGSALIASCVLLELFLRSISFGPPPIPEIPGCYLTKGSVAYVFISFLIVLANDTIIMIYTLWIGLWNFRHSHNPLVTVLYRDGIMYYLILCIISAVNLATLIQAPNPLGQLLNTFLRVFHSILSSRILLNVRDVQYGEAERRANIRVTPVVSLTLTGPIPDRPVPPGW